MYHIVDLALVYNTVDLAVVYNTVDLAVDHDAVVDEQRIAVAVVE